MSYVKWNDKRSVGWSRPCAGLAVAVMLALAGMFQTPARAAELWVGAATVDVTPERPVALSGQRRVRIHAVGFPVLFSRPDLSMNAVRFAALMRKLAEDNNGSFVGLNSARD